jgi:hypothetical protein
MNPYEGGPKPTEPAAEPTPEELKQLEEAKVASEKNEGQIAESGKSKETKEEIEDHYRRMRKLRMGGPNRRSQESRKAIIEKEGEKITILTEEEKAEIRKLRRKRHSLHEAQRVSQYLKNSTD